MLHREVGNVLTFLKYTFKIYSDTAKSLTLRFMDGHGP
jgi:hypothetical protein